MADMSIGDLIRKWRSIRKCSQLDLALAIDVSPKHMSFVESGRSNPSRQLVRKVAAALEVPYRHRNAMLVAAGYAPEIKVEPLSGATMTAVREGLTRLIANHAPYPAVVINAEYDILLRNGGFHAIVRHFAGPEIAAHDNLLRIMCGAGALHERIVGWHTIRSALAGRVRQECVLTQSPRLQELADELFPTDAQTDPPAPSEIGLLPFLAVTLELGSAHASFFTAVTAIGAPLDPTTQELRIELFFAADEQTKQLIATLAEDADLHAVFP